MFLSLNNGSTSLQHELVCISFVILSSFLNTHYNHLEKTTAVSLQLHNLKNKYYSQMFLLLLTILLHYYLQYKISMCREANYKLIIDFILLYIETFMNLKWNTARKKCCSLFKKKKELT